MKKNGLNTINKFLTSLFGKPTNISSAARKSQESHPFAGLGLNPVLVKAAAAMGYKDPMPIQSRAIPLLLEGADLLGCAQTGSGKTAAFVLPIFDRMLRCRKSGLRVLVLVPTRELAAQVSEAFRELGRGAGFRTVVIIGGVGYEGQLSSVSKGAAVMVATPGRLLDHLQRANFNLSRVEFLVLDEADRMLDMGFLPDIRAIINRVPKQRQTMLFSATLMPEIEKIAAFALRNPQRIDISPPASTAEGISQVLYPVMKFQKADLLMALLKSTEMKSVLVFCGMKHTADRLFGRLRAGGFSIDVLHSDRTQSQRTKTMDDFRNSRFKILVATDIAARGIDVRNISHVINYDVPRYPEDYVHRVGRTARAYGVGDAITLMDSEEQPYVAAIERFLGVTFPRAMLPGFNYMIPPKLEPAGPKKMSSVHWGRKKIAGSRGALFRKR
ncbi:MAG: DEAD/DEAH box helicase [bacterium]